MQESSYKSALYGIFRKYNKSNKIPLPKITPHTLRHTFCTRLAQKKMNSKNLQYIMGHSSITITLDLYAHASETGANVEMRSLIAWFTTKCTTIESKDIRDKVQLHGVSVKREKPPNPYKQGYIDGSRSYKKIRKNLCCFSMKRKPFLPVCPLEDLPYLNNFVYSVLVSAMW